MNEPWYGILWHKIKHFPGKIARGNQNPPELSGKATAALLSGAIGCITMMIFHHISDSDKTKTVENKILKLGSWIPGADSPDPLWGNIGNYAGKETILLISWLVSWVILHFWLRNKNVKAGKLLFWLITLMTLATAMSWHPLFPYLPLA